MTTVIRPAQETDLSALIELTLMAFEPIFKSFKRILGEEIFPVLHPDWRETHRKIVVDAFEDEDIGLWVAEMDGIAAGLATLKLDQKRKIGELHFLAVHPVYQNQGVGTVLNRFILEKMREAGMEVAMVSTGGDPSHAPARRVYEKAGFISLPIVNYYQEL
jgi:N-acetylglutamate synthase-like GNAT family acetyltransferase